VDRYTRILYRALGLRRPRAAAPSRPRPGSSTRVEAPRSPATTPPPTLTLSSYDQPYGWCPTPLDCCLCGLPSRLCAPRRRSPALLPGRPVRRPAGGRRGPVAAAPSAAAHTLLPRHHLPFKAIPRRRPRPRRRRRRRGGAHARRAAQGPPQTHRPRPLRGLPRLPVQVPQGRHRRPRQGVLGAHCG